MLFRSRAGDFKKNGRLGCPACYESFAEELQQILAGMQCGPTHNGKLPRHAPPVPVPAQKAPPRRRRKPATTAPDSQPTAPTAPAIPPPATKTAAPTPTVPRKALERQLAEAIRTENYEEAARLRDALQQGNPGA